MPHSEPPRSPLIYAQDEDFLTLVGEPIELTPTSRIVVAKADGFYAEALRATCAQAFPKTEAEVCRSGGALLTALRQRPTDLAVIGLTFADLDGIDVLDANAREHWVRRVFIVSSRKDEHTLSALRTARFDGFFDPIEEGGTALVPALQQVASGRGYISPALCRRWVERRASGALTRRLTLAERLVFSVIGDGSDDREAAERLGLRKATVQSYRRNVMHKLDVATSAKLVTEAVRLGVVRISPDGEIVRPGFERLLAEWRAKRASRSGAEP